MSLANELISAASGKVFDYAGIKLPAGFLWANGQAVSRSTFARLFAALTLTIGGTTASGSATISSVDADLTAATLGMDVRGWPVSGPGIPAGATIAAVTANSVTLSAPATANGSGVSAVVAPHGVGDGSTTFNIPDFRGRTAVGRDDMGGTAANRMTTAGGGVNGVQLGHAAGAETHTLTTAQLAAHNHGVTDPGHNHATNANIQQTQGSSGTGGAAIFSLWGSASNTASTTGISTQNNGSGSAHNNTQPSLVCHKIIKT